MKGRTVSSYYSVSIVLARERCLCEAFSTFNLRSDGFMLFEVDINRGDEGLVLARELNPLQYNDAVANV